ncbi:MAG TPA: cupin domain-containing protein [candidate division Zixibacteria bacterium]|nr:cupin domain-containing protein [candidate division Zixibacteria bacterium]
MLVRSVNSVEKEAVTSNDSTGTTIQWLISKEQGAPRFAMRLFTLEPNANISIHGHPEEHEIYILEGECDLIAEDGTRTRVNANDVIFMPPEELHGYENVGSEELKFICVIPLLKK